MVSISIFSIGKDDEFIGRAIVGKGIDGIVALTAIELPTYRKGERLRSTHVLHNDWTRRVIPL